MRLALCTFIMLVICSQVFSATIYVPDMFPGIQDAINASIGGDTIVVRPGTYVENIDFVGKIIKLESERGPKVTVIDGNQAGSVVTFQSGETNDTHLYGFTIKNGYSSIGGGIYCESSSPSITNNVISNNVSSKKGGGIYCSNCALIFEFNEIIENQSNLGGGGIYCYYSTAIFRNNVVSQNTLVDGYGGGIHNDNSNSEYVNSIISHNSAKNGGGIYMSGNNVSIKNSIIAFNSAANVGGGIFCDGDTMDLLNNTIYGNSGVNGGGITCHTNIIVQLQNSILWSNSATTGKEINLWNHNGTPTIKISYSDVEGGIPSIHVDAGCTLDLGVGNIDDDPRFVDALVDDFHLTWQSPCKDMGSNFLPNLPTEDCEGDPRVYYDVVDIGADEFYFHLYHLGDVVPGGTVDMRVVGPYTYEVILAISSDTQSPPLSTPYGNFYLTLPMSNQWSIGAISSNGLLEISPALPWTWISGEEYYFQALVGDMNWPHSHLTNLMVMNVE